MNEMKPLHKAAIFLMLIGAEKGKRVISLMDNHEIRAIAKEIGNMTQINSTTQQQIWDELEELGYESNMNSAEILDILRLLFDDGKIGA